MNSLWTAFILFIEFLLKVTLYYVITIRSVAVGEHMYHQAMVPIRLPTQLDSCHVVRGKFEF